MSAKLKIYGDAISGNCLKVKWTADRLGLDYDWIETSVLEGETRTPEFLKMNPAGQVPTVVLPDGRVLAQSNAIIIYLNNVHKGGLLPEEPYAQGKVFEWLFWEQYSHETAIAVRRFHKHYLKKSEAEIDPKLMEKGAAALTLMEGALEDGAYLVGDKLTLADISLVAYTRLAHEGGFDLVPYPAIRQWIARVERDLGINSAEAA
ncbi:glutathione S-transferase family protein [Hyphococcus luteus]|uniref:Glutathione S-transferase family protein n=1 Tax=Hyphococcus luteus TaxID=2058213 RepID=A0A2S7K5S8_9PROT|nr:glutathione S-transferase family protein [Marinicaulis flavus]PQA87852.1 glutathione S-transferase family protein [Marinicaulis flavus]